MSSVSPPRSSREETPASGELCKRVPHFGTGYLHGADDDGPYDVDGDTYCGRCHRLLPHEPIDEDSDLDEAESYIAALRGPLLHYFGTTDPELLIDVWKTEADAIDEFRSALASQGPGEPTPDAEDLLAYLDDCGSGTNVHFVQTKNHDGKRDEMRPDGLWIWVNAPIGDPDEPGAIDGENISDALRDSLREQSSAARSVSPAGPPTPSPEN